MPVCTVLCFHVVESTVSLYTSYSYHFIHSWFFRHHTLLFFSWLNNAAGTVLTVTTIISICNAYVSKRAHIQYTAPLPPSTEATTVYQRSINMHSFAKSTKVTYMTRFSVHSNCVLHLWDLAAHATLISAVFPRTAFFWRGCWTYPHTCMPGSPQVTKVTPDTWYSTARAPLQCHQNGCH